VPAKNKNLHGNVPDKCNTALLLIDVINDLEFEGGDSLARQALPMARKIRALKDRAKDFGIPSIYVNDNFGKWRSNFQKQVRHCLQDGTCGKELVEQLKPDSEDYFILKPKHSGFYSTTLDTLLAYLGAKNLILTGIAGDRCVLFTANDAFLRDFNLFVPADCVISNHPSENKQALTLMKRILKADLCTSTRIDLKVLCKR
jgi:nicotinamidase-related amidase